MHHFLPPCRLTKSIWFSNLWDADHQLSQGARIQGTHSNQPQVPLPSQRLPWCWTSPSQDASFLDDTKLPWFISNNSSVTVHSACKGPEWSRFTSRGLLDSNLRPNFVPERTGSRDLPSRTENTEVKKEAQRLRGPGLRVWSCPASRDRGQGRKLLSWKWVQNPEKANLSQSVHLLL